MHFFRHAIDDSLIDFLVTAGDPSEVEELLALELAQFFSREQKDVSVALIRTLATVNVSLESDYDQFVDRLLETETMLEEYLNLLGRGRRQGNVNWEIKVLAFATTCGVGYSLEPGFNSSNTTSAPSGTTLVPSDSDPSGICLPCWRGFHKSAADNSPCVSCPPAASTPSEGATDADSCDCVEGYRQANQTELPDGWDVDALFCVRKGQFVSVKAAKEAAQAVSAAVGVVVGTNVAVVVASTVASTVATSVAASSGGAAAAAAGEGVAGSATGGSGGGTTALITQVQFLNQVGRIGGSQGSESMAGFSEGLGW